jgi:hypothetical protein
MNLMQKYHVNLWSAARRHGNVPEPIPHTYVEAENDMEARALAIDEFAMLGVSFDADAITYAKVSSGNEDKDEQDESGAGCSVADVIAWARAEGKKFVAENELEFFLAL